MLARGFQGGFRALRTRTFGAADVVFLMASFLVVAGARAAVEVCA
jgi:hypothetical protein